MDAISTTVPSINLRKLHHFYHLKPPLHFHQPHISTSATVAGKPPTPISTKLPPPTYHNHLQPTPSHTAKTHRNAATGYAAALVDAALNSKSLDAVHKDVKKLLNWLQHNEMLKGLMDDPLVDEGVKGKVVKEVVEKGKFRRQLVVMVKMLVAKKRSGMVVQVIKEFQRIYYELNGGLRVVV